MLELIRNTVNYSCLILLSIQSLSSKTSIFFWGENNKLPTLSWLFSFLLLFEIDNNMGRSQTQKNESSQIIRTLMNES